MKGSKMDPIVQEVYEIACKAVNIRLQRNKSIGYLGIIYHASRIVEADLTDEQHEFIRHNLRELFEHPTDTTNITWLAVHKSKVDMVV